MMDLQFFSDTAAAPTNGAPEGSSNDQSAEQTSQPEAKEPAKQEKTFTQDQVDEMIQKRLDRALKGKQQEIDDAKAEAVKYAKMNKNEKQAHDLEKAQQAAKVENKTRDYNPHLRKSIVRNTGK
ncbi:capsid assembly scaffolding protein Gp46 family protein [Limosilactobacillus difficilis]|uniref:capsid assembly scaffolding protein Gp46 family protein n=1 Tax=Limosilactobacillus difficilis TaxID=2991838 RepID=UPI0024B9D138|nr:DUF4355 domain-containing protein [Limosilactobacillus difficilis]